MKLSFSFLCEKLEISRSQIRQYTKNTLYFSSVRLYSHTSPLPAHGGLFLVDSRQTPHFPAVLPPHTAFLFTELPAHCPNAPYAIADTDIQDLLNRLMNLFDFYNAWSDQLQTILNRNGSIQEYLDCSFPVFENTLFIVDTSFKVLGFVKNQDMCDMSAAYRYLSLNGYLPLQTVAGMKATGELDELDAETKAIFYESNFFYSLFISRNLYSNGYFQGRLYINTMLKPLGNWALELADHLGDILSLVMQKSEYFQQTRGSVYEHFMVDVLSGNLTDKYIISRQLSILNWKTDGIYCLLAVPLHENLLSTVLSLSTLFEKSYNSKATYYSDALLVVFSLDSYAAILPLEKSLHSLLSGLHISGGISDSFSGFWQLPRYYQQAQTAYRLGVQQEYKYLYSYHDYVIPHLLDICSSSISLSTLCHKTVFLLQEHDRQHHTEYCQTLKTYLECERSQTLTARKLFIHRNTLIGRIDRILQLTSLDLDDPATRLRLILTFQLLEHRTAQLQKDGKEG